MHTLLPFSLIIITVIILLNMLATKLKIAYPILLIIGGLLIGFIPGLPNISIKPDMIFFVFLPPLLFFSAGAASIKEMRKWWRMIGSFAFPVVFITALTVALVANYFIPGFSISLGFLLGGIVSPPDAVSTAAITKFVKIPKVFTTVLEGESLVNDASSLIIFRFAMLAVGTGQFIWQDAIAGFLWMVIGGTSIGLLLGWIFIQMHRNLPTDAPTDIVFILIEPYAMYWIAEQVHCSGVLAVVAGGLYMTNKWLTFLNSTSRLRAVSVWESFIFLLNGVVFFIIGLTLPDIVKGLRSEGILLGTAISYSLLITIVLIVTRVICCYVAQLGTFIFRRKLLPPKIPRRAYLVPLVLGWTGMRGVVSLAAALSIPIMYNGIAFPHRNLILFITFVVIFLTLVVQGLTLPYFITRSKAFDIRVLTDSSEEEQDEKIKTGLRKEVYEFLKHKYNNGHLQDNAIFQKMMQHWEENEKADNDDWMSEETRYVYIESLEAQRKYLSELNKDPSISEELIRKQLYLLDLQEERLKLG
ncbi:Na+/H+ antiporter [Chryseobacterium sp. MEBOG07]|uniref:Na+/H+ antiporter n=1 Tax=Chryseobacterium sp. MEBOG07 TaxID=2879939 RepID=UPI001F021E39|nr:Na+/H+ antiporter [Chryseobacterium sp. MEBOG07]UKB78336.1 Na+/H+ antiporter [Chryseobacterium sp. MEBOG07]